MVYIHARGAAVRVYFHALGATVWFIFPHLEPQFGYIFMHWEPQFESFYTLGASYNVFSRTGSHSLSLNSLGAIVSMYFQVLEATFRDLSLIHI